MMWKVVVVVVVCLVACLTEVVLGNTEEMAIHKQMSKDPARKYARPVKNYGTTVDVTYGFELISIMEFDWENKKIVLRVDEEISWKDEYWTWDPPMYNGLQQTVAKSNFWRPDVEVIGRLEVQRVEKDDLHRHVVKSFDGTATNKRPNEYSFRAEQDGPGALKVTMKVGSIDYTAEEVNFDAKEDNINIDRFEPGYSFSEEPILNDDNTITFTFTISLA